MRFVAPRLGNAPEATIAEDQLEYRPITVAILEHGDGTRTLVARLRLDAKERAAIAAGEDLYVGQLNFQNGPGSPEWQPMTPLMVSVGPETFTGTP
jgi:hypothetical protein